MNNSQGARPMPASLYGMQFDLIRHSDQSQAAAYRMAAETARVDPFWTDEQREARARHYLAEAERLEKQQ